MTLVWAVHVYEVSDFYYQVMVTVVVVVVVAVAMAVLCCVLSATSAVLCVSGGAVLEGISKHPPDVSCSFFF